MSLPETGKRKRGRAKLDSPPARYVPPSEEPRIFINIQVGLSTFKALVDPGSVCSYVDKTTADRFLAQGWAHREDDTVAVMADGTEMPLGKRLSGQLSAMGKLIEAEVSILSNLSHEILLGIDLLSFLGLEISINKQKVFPPLRNYIKGRSAPYKGPYQ